MGRQVAEVMRALAVLAVLFLNFGHVPQSAPVHQEAGWAALAFSICGDAPGGDERSHAPCHACRIGSGADVPPAPDCPIHAPAPTPVRYHQDTRTSVAAAAHSWPSARAPPALV